jgi:hypothetical protein
LGTTTPNTVSLPTPSPAAPQILSELFYVALSGGAGADRALLQSLRDVFRAGDGDVDSASKRRGIVDYFAPKLSAEKANDRDSANMALNLILTDGVFVCWAFA